MKPAIDIIYNMTSICPHDCPVCCVDAAHVTRRGGTVNILTEGLSERQQVHRDKSESIYDTAARALQARGRELSVEQKFQIIDHLDVDRVRLDISGGDPLVVSDNLHVLRKASRKLGANFITLTATGVGMARIDLTELVHLVGEFNFTYDSASKDDVADRPQAYAGRNLQLGRDLARLGAKTRAEFPITCETSNPDHVRRLYIQLHEAGIDKLLLMRLFAVGRGHTVAHKTLSAREYLEVIRQLRALEREFGRPVVSLQCALRHLEQFSAGARTGSNPCDFVRESFGLTPQGILLASPWAINANGRPLDDAFILGNLVETPLSEILAGPRIKEIRARADQNFGQCKIFAWQNSVRSSSFERLFDSTDPLYAEEPAWTEAAE